MDDNFLVSAASVSSYKTNALMSWLSCHCSETDWRSKKDPKPIPPKLASSMGMLSHHKANFNIDLGLLNFSKHYLRNK
jgi:predicted transcriptional regulator